MDGEQLKVFADRAILILSHADADEALESLIVEFVEAGADIADFGRIAADIALFATADPAAAAAKWCDAIQRSYRKAVAIILMRRQGASEEQIAEMLALSEESDEKLSA